MVEDEQRMARMYKQVFEVAGFEMKLALTSEEGWEKLEEEKPDLVLLDILLPGEDGVSFLRKLRESEEYGDLSVFVLSNYDVPETKEEVAELGVEAYLMKANFTPARLVEEVKKHLAPDKT